MNDSIMEELKKMSFNYDHDGTFDLEDGWIHDYRRERIGMDLPADSYRTERLERLRVLLKGYKFPDPDLIEGNFDENAPLLGRNISLCAKFLGFKFRFGVRIVEVVDQIQDVEGKRLYSWGYSYRTLGDHFEQGQIRFEIQKDLTSGAVFLVVESYSRQGEIANPFYWLGMKIFGRSLQKKFVDSTFQSVIRAYRGGKS